MGHRKDEKRDSGRIVWGGGGGGERAVFPCLSQGVLRHFLASCQILHNVLTVFASKRVMFTIS